MKYLFAGLAIASISLSTTVHAGGMAEPLMAPEVIAEETSSSANPHIIVPLMFIAMVLAVQ